MTPTRDWDAIVVGGGLGGLTAAAFLAARGQRVLVLEQHTVAGGNSQVFRRRGAFEFDVGTHYIGDCGPSGVVPSIYRGLGLAERITFREIDPDGFDRIVLPSTNVRVPRGWSAYRDRLVRALPAEAAAVRACVDILAAMHARERAPGSPAVRHATAAVLNAVPRCRAMTLGELMRHCRLSARARTVLAGQIANLGLAPDDVALPSHVTMLGGYLQGAYYPEGGGQMLAATLVEALAGHGGEVRTRSRVSRILVERGRAGGVRLADGTVVRAPVVISNADYRRTILDLVGARHFPAEVVAGAQQARMALPIVILYLAISQDVPPLPASNLWWFESEDIDGIFAELADGKLGQPRFAFISSGSAKGGPSGPGPLAMGGDRPRGKSRLRVPHHTAEVMTLCPTTGPWAVGDDAPAHSYRYDATYQAEKRRISASLLALAERALGPLDGSLLHCEVAMPHTQSRFAYSTGGTAYGLASTPRQVGPRRPGHRTALPGLFLAGASTRTGFGISAVMAGGALCAEAVLGESLLYDVCAGTVLGNPVLPGTRPPGWDPLLASRGSRAARARDAIAAPVPGDR